MLMLLYFGTHAQKTGKSKNLKLNYTLPEGWNAREFGSTGSKSWEEGGTEPDNTLLCKCSGIHFSKLHKDGKLHVVVYPSRASGLDSSKRNAVGPLQFVDVEKYDNIRNNGVSFRRKKSNFKNTTTNKIAYEVYRYFAKVDDHYFIIYAWQENMQHLTSINEKLLIEMVNAIEPY